MLTYIPFNQSVGSKFSVDFDGVNDFANIAAPPADLQFERSSTFSESMWVKTVGVETGRLISQRAPVAPNAGPETFLASGKPSIFLGEAGDAVFGESVGTITTGEWNNVIFTWDGSSDITGVNIYINGVSQTVTNLGNNLVTDFSHTGPMNFAKNSGGAQHLDARMNHLSFYNIELSQSLVNELYNSGNVRTGAGIEGFIHEWPLGDGDTFPTLIDIKAGADATMTNMVEADIVEDAPP